MRRSKDKMVVIIPVYNEQDGLRKIAHAFKPYLLASKFDVSVLFVNDGSTDESLSVIRELSHRYTWINYLSFSKNCGLSAALYSGFKEAKTKWVGYIDADLQTIPMDFLKLEEFVPEYSLVTGLRVDRQDSLVKKISSVCANRFRQYMLHDGVLDSGCPLKIFHRKTALRMPFFKGMHRFFPALVQLQNKQIKEVEVRHFPRLSGKSKFNLWSRLLSPLVDTFAVKWMAIRSVPVLIEEKSTPHTKLSLHE